MVALNYYPFHVGDYTAHTAHLDPLEDVAYRRMLDVYYLRECALPADPADVARLIRMRGNLAEVECVLREFFDLGERGWTHDRCEEELSKMQDKQTKARASAAASVNARKANAQRTLNERSTNVELPTPTPIPIPKDQKSSGSPDGDPAAGAAKPSAATVKSERLAQVTTDAVAAYNATLGKPHGQLAAVHLVNEVRQNQVKRCLGVARAICERTLGAPTITAEFWRDYFAECKRDPFKNGEGPYTGSHANWRPDFEYLTRKDVMTTLFDRAMSEAT